MRTMTISLLGLMASLLVASTVAYAQETIKLADDRQVKSADDDTAFQFDLKEIPKGKQFRLYFDARIEHGSLGGYTPAMQAWINEKGLNGRDLINKPLVFTTRNGMEIHWSSTTGDANFILMYSPDFSDRIKTDENYIYGLPDTDPFRFGFDITPHVRAGSNTVKVSSPRWCKLPLRLRNVYVEVGDPIPSLNPPPPPPPPAPTGPLPVYLPKGRAEVSVEMEVSPSGNIRFKIGQYAFKVSSRTSLPKGEWSDEGNTDDIWKRLPRGKSVVAQWKGLDYTVERKITLHADHISVADTISNTGEGLVGIIFENRLELPEKPLKTLLCGVGVVGLKQRESPAHPTAMTQFKDLVIGMVAEDDIFRTHCKSFADGSTIGLADPQLGIAPGKAHTLEWSIYMAPNGDYWDFINAIRDDWGSNITIEGPVVMACSSTARVGAKLFVTEASFSGVTEKDASRDKPILACGTAVPLCKEWADDVRKLVQKVKEFDPSAKVFGYTHHNYCTEPGYWEKYRDSVMLDWQRQPVTVMYSSPYGVFVPTLENSYGRALMEKSETFMVEDLGVNLYIDEISSPPNGSYDYNGAWDGCSVIINPVSHEVTGKRNSTFLLMQPWRTALMKYLKSKGRTAMGNGAHITRTMLNWKILCFVEGGQGYANITQTHLGTPWVWGNGPDRPSPDHFKSNTQARKCLDYGAVFFFPQWVLDFTTYMYPITPIELRSGVVIGKERILTDRSGRFGWGDDSRAEVHVFDGQGERVEKPDVKDVRQGDKVLTELRMPSDHLAILVRKKK